MNSHIYAGYDLVIDVVPVGSRVLDLGCGTGELLMKLQKEKKVKGFGVEISEDGVSSCVEKGLYCYHGDIDEGLEDYKDNSFDCVILNQTIQNTKHPDYVMNEIMRICKMAIVSFPNFAFLKTRFEFLMTGSMPKNELLPYEWYESPNIHLLTIKDFIELCEIKKYPIKKEAHFAITSSGKTVVLKILPNIFAQYGFFVLDGEAYTSIKK